MYQNQYSFEIACGATKRDRSLYPHAVKETFEKSPPPPTSGFFWGGVGRTISKKTLVIGLIIVFSYRKSSGRDIPAPPPNKTLATAPTRSLLLNFYVAKFLPAARFFECLRISQVSFFVQIIFQYSLFFIRKCFKNLFVSCFFFS